MFQSQRIQHVLQENCRKLIYKKKTCFCLKLGFNTKKLACVTGVIELSKPLFCSMLMVRSRSEVQGLHVNHNLSSTC